MINDPRVVAAFKMYEAVPVGVRDDLVEAVVWARNTLRDHEGSGHCFHIHATKDGLLQCSFAKPEWAGDHCGASQEEASHAVVWAVCEYLSGL